MPVGYKQAIFRFYHTKCHETDKLFFSKMRYYLPSLYNHYLKSVDKTDEQ